ncbi:hypothetical protein WJ84_01980 [Burkholderia ubonensis]|nr:hypothetical protein WJ84_01980 [Burkholderia ubonensis]KVP39809.1 hypothetical protein WJ87_06395 [Burkholderia ubonensis]
MTLDEYIEELQRLKASGVPGNTVIALAGTDNNNRGVIANFEVRPHLRSVAKADFDKGWTIAKFVSQRGIQILLLG